MLNQSKRISRRRWRTVAAAIAATSISAARIAGAADTSPPVILQWFESSWKTMELRTPDLFMAGYGAVWTPPPGRALYDDQGGGIGYNLYDRFDLGKANDTTLYGTEAGYRSFINSVHQMNGDVYVDYVHHHVGSWDVPAYTGNPGAPTVPSTREYPGFELSDPGQWNRDTYPSPPPSGDVAGMTDPFEYEYRLANLITIDLTNHNNRFFVRNPVPGFAANIPQSANNFAIATSTLLPNGKAGASTVLRQANTPDENNRRFYPDQNLPGITVTDNGQQYTIHPFNLTDNTAGDPTAEDTAGYMMRYAQWLVNDLGVDGLRIDAARHVPHGTYNDPDSNVDVPALIDRAVYRESRRTNLDGTQRQVFSFQEVFTGDKAFNQTYIRKDINPATPNVVGGNRDVLDFPMWFAMRNNFTTDGSHNNWYNVRFASQDSQDDGNANNGSQGIGFVINHDDGRGDASNQANDYIALDNVAHAWILMRPGNAYVYYNAHEFDRTGNSSFFLKDGRGDALGGQYGSIITNLLDIRNSYGRGNFQERWIDSGGSSAVYAFERLGSCVVGLNIGYNPGSAARTINTSFAPGTHLVELTGNWQDPSGTVPQTITVNGSGQATINIPWNNSGNGNKGYVIYGLPRPQGTMSLSNVSQVLSDPAPTPSTNGTARLTPISVITSNSFNVTLNTTAVTFSDGYRDKSADGDRAYLRFDGGLDLNGNGTVDFRSNGDTRYGFESFGTTNHSGFTDVNGVGAYAQTIDASQLSEGYHYITAQAYRQRSDGGPDVFSSFKKVIYVDRVPPISALESFNQSGALSSSREVQVRSTDQTADRVYTFLNLGAALTDAQVQALTGSGNSATQIDRDLFSRNISGVPSGNNVVTTVTYEITGNMRVQRFTGIATASNIGSGLGDTNFDNARTAADVTNFESTLYTQNQQFNPAGDLNGDGKVNDVDLFALPAFYKAMGTPAASIEARNAVLRRGNLNNDSITNAADIDTLYQNLGSTNWTYDLDASGGAANASDVDTLVRTILHSEYGDANLDGAINALDFNAIATHFGQSGQGWANGNFNGDGAVNTADFTLLSQNFNFHYADPLAPLGLGSLIPEPATFSLLLFSFAASFRRCRLQLKSSS